MNADQVVEGIGKAVAATKPAQEYCFLWIDWWPMCMTKAEWSGWVQAVGSIAAIGASVSITRWLNGKEKRESTERAELTAQVNLIPYASRLATIAKRFEALHGAIASSNYVPNSLWVTTLTGDPNRPVLPWVQVIREEVEKCAMPSPQDITSVAAVDLENANALSICVEALRQLREHLANAPQGGKGPLPYGYKAICRLVEYVASNAKFADERTQKFLKKRNVPLNVSDA